MVDKLNQMVYNIDRKEVKAVEQIKTEVDEMTYTQTIITAIKIIAEKSKNKEEFLKELDRLLKEKPQ